ncbi:MAG TPA: hypothetical protein PLD25_25605 [Chloroflexota bacterium]|nr:hypothetical protein [Chloroflexota bacterium]
MRTFKLVVAWILVALSVLGIIAVLIGLVASWSVRNRATEATVNLLTAGETAVTTLSNGIGRIDDRLAVTQQNIQTLETNITTVGADVTENSLVGQAISAQISEETAANIAEARATVQAITDAVNTLNAAINAANAIPFVQLDGFVAELVSDIADGIAELEQNITTFRTSVQERREERITDTVGYFTGITGQMSDRVTQVQSRLETAETRLSTTTDRLESAKVRLPRIYTTLTIAANVALLLIGVAFVSLLLHGWVLAHNPDLTLKELTAGKNPGGGQVVMPETRQDTGQEAE